MEIEAKDLDANQESLTDFAACIWVRLSGRKLCAERKGTAVPRKDFFLLPHPTNGPALAEETLCSEMVDHIHVTPGSLDDTMEILLLDLLVTGD